MTCAACPFAFTDESEHVQNLACLPTPGEILAMKRTQDINWPCHETDEHLCAGFAVECAERGLNVKTGRLGSYVRWYRTGEALTDEDVSK